MIVIETFSPGCEAEVAAETKQDRHVMSLTSCERCGFPVCTENLIRVDDALETPKLTVDPAFVFRPGRLGRVNQFEDEA